MTALSFLYLWLGLWLLTCSVGVLSPRALRRVLGRPLSALMSLPAMILTLFLPQFIAGGVGLTLLLGWLGALRGPLGSLGLLLHLISWALLLNYLWQVHGALPVLDGQVVRDDDHPFVAGIPEEERRQLPPGRVSWRPSLTYRTPAMAAVEVTRDVVFRRHGPVRLRLDVYRPRHNHGPCPALLYIHGGAWITGNRRQSRYMLYELAAAGWAVFAISYRFAPRFPLPAAIEDCKAALAWVREHGAAYGARTDDLVVIGGSAGGHLAALLALTPNDPRFQPGFESADTRVSGAVVFYGVHEFEIAFSDRALAGFALFLERVVFKARYRDDPAPFRLAQPMTHLRGDAPPMLLVHGENDALVPIEASRTFARKLREAGAPAVHLLEVPLGPHAFEVTPGPLHQRSLRVILRFLASLRHARPEETRAPAPA